MCSSSLHANLTSFMSDWYVSYCYSKPERLLSYFLQKSDQCDYSDIKNTIRLMSERGLIIGESGSINRTKPNFHQWKPLKWYKQLPKLWQAAQNHFTVQNQKCIPFHREIFQPGNSTCRKCPYKLRPFPAKYFSAYYLAAHSNVRTKSHNSLSHQCSWNHILTELSAHWTSLQYLSFSGQEKRNTVTLPHARDSSMTLWI